MSAGAHDGGDDEDDEEDEEEEEEDDDEARVGDSAASMRSGRNRAGLNTGAVRGEPIAANAVAVPVSVGKRACGDETGDARLAPMAAESLLARRTGIEPGAASEARGDAHRRRCDDDDDDGSGRASERRDESGAEVERAGVPCWRRLADDEEDDETEEADDEDGDEAAFECDDLAGAEMRRIVIVANSCHLRSGRKQPTRKQFENQLAPTDTANRHTMTHGITFNSQRTASRHRHS